MQQELNFDIATLEECIARIENRRARRLIRGLLLTALTEPHLVEEIDSDGCVLMTASNATVAKWAEVSEESVRINTRQISEIRPTIIEKSPTVNTPSEWLVMLSNVMPAEVVQIVVDILNSSKKLGVKLPPTFEKLPPTLPPTNAKVGGKVAPNFQNLSSICLSFNTASLAELAGKLESFGIAVRGQADWSTLQVDHSALTRPEALEAIAECVCPDRPILVFVAAVIACDDSPTPWNLFRWMITSGKFREQFPSKPQQRKAELMLQLVNGTDAAEIVSTTAHEAWGTTLAAMRRWDFMYQSAELKSELGERICAAVRQAGGFSKIANSNPKFQNELRKAFVDAYEASEAVLVSMQTAKLISAERDGYEESSRQ